MEQVKGMSRRQGACPLRSAYGVLDCGFPGVTISMHPDPNPLRIWLSLRRGPILYLLHVKRGIKPLFSGAGEGNTTLSRRMPAARWLRQP